MSNLSDYGAGVEHDPDPEDEVKIHLSKWLENHGCKVYWEKDPSYGYKKFTTESTENPDLLVENRYKNKYWLIEVKIGDDSGAIHRAVPQLLRYYRMHQNNEQVYKIRGKQVEPYGFLLATRNAFHGKLYKSDGVREVLHEETWAKHNDASFLPTQEYGATETVVRILWQMASDEFPASTTHIGALLADVLDHNPPKKPITSETPWQETSTKPKALYYKPKAEDNHEQFWRGLDE